MPRARRAPVEGRVIPAEPARLDLHTHTRRSDGVAEPRGLVEQAAAVGVRLLAITDHDTLAGARELMRASDLPVELELLPGVEINTVAAFGGLPDGELHLLGLGVNPADDAFEQVLARQRTLRAMRFEAMVQRLAATGTPVDRELESLDRSSIDALGRPTLARALVRAGHADDVQDAFVRFVGRGKPGYAPRSGIGPIEAIRAIRAAGGLAVLAHFSEAPRRPDVIDELRDAGLRGLEVYYRAFDRDTVNGLEVLAVARRLVPTGGTDYHGDDEPYAAAHAELAIPAHVASGVRSAVAGLRAGHEPRDAQAVSG